MVKNSPILEIQGLKASVNDTAVIKDLNLTVNPGEIHAIMGKNGSGKSTFSKIVSKGINSLANDSNAVILITHYQRLLDYIEPTFIHVMQDGKIIKTGDKSLAKELESKGYDWLK